MKLIVSLPETPVMNKKMKKIYHKNIYSLIVAIALILSMILILAINYAFLHIHIMPNGEIICHSHLIAARKSPDQSEKLNHTHSKDELLFYHLTTNFYKFFITVILVILGICINFFILFQFINLQHQGVRFIFSRRAPPRFPFLTTLKIKISSVGGHFDSV